MAGVGISSVYEANCTMQHTRQEAMVLRDTCLGPLVIVSLTILSDVSFLSLFLLIVSHFYLCYAVLSDFATMW